MTAPGAIADGTVVLRCLGVAGRVERVDGLLYVADYDPEYAEGYGLVSFTSDPAKAARWPTPTAALAAWRYQSRVRPLRDDGEPNRPMTAYHMEVLSL